MSNDSKIIGRITHRRTLTFDEALVAVRGCELWSASDYQEAWKNHLLPDGLPANPQYTYAGEGWISWGHFLGDSYAPNHVAPASKRPFVNLKRAAEIVQRLGISGEREFRAWSAGHLTEIDGDRLPTFKVLNIPANPHLYYKGKGWTSYPDFFGTPTLPGRAEYVGLARASELAREHRVTNFSDWRALVWSLGRRDGKNGLYLPLRPSSVYQEHGWAGWEAFTGVPRGAVYMPLEDLRALVRRLAIRGQVEYQRWYKGEVIEKNGVRLPRCPDGVPYKPADVYGEAWLGWGELTGTGFKRGRPVAVRLPYEQAREHVRSLGLVTPGEYRAYLCGDLSEKNGLPLPPPPGKGLLPPRPDEHYGADFSWADFLGEAFDSSVPSSRQNGRRIGRPRSGRLPFDEARAFVRGLGLTSQNQYKEYAVGRLRELNGVSLPPPPGPGVPSEPVSYYGDAWTTWEDFVGESYKGTPPIQERYWTLERLLAEAVKYSSGAEWERTHRASYNAATRHGHYHECMAALRAAREKRSA